MTTTALQITARERLESTGTDEIVARIEAGETQAELAQSIGVAVGSLNDWLHRHPERSARARAAMLASAEALADRGRQELVQAEGSMAEISRARALEQHWRWRAAIRNPQYRDKVDHAHSGQVTHAVESMSRAQLEQIAAQGLPLVERCDDQPAE